MMAAKACAFWSSYLQSEDVCVNTHLWTIVHLSELPVLWAYLEIWFGVNWHSVGSYTQQPTDLLELRSRRASLYFVLTSGLSEMSSNSTQHFSKCVADTMDFGGTNLTSNIFVLLFPLCLLHFPCPKYIVFETENMNIINISAPIFPSEVISNIYLRTYISQYKILNMRHFEWIFSTIILQSKISLSSFYK